MDPELNTTFLNIFTANEKIAKEYLSIDQL